MNKPNEFKFYKPDFELDRSKLETFLRNFIDKNMAPDELHDRKKYMVALVNKLKFNSLIASNRK